MKLEQLKKKYITGIRHDWKDEDLQKGSLVLDNTKWEPEHNIDWEGIITWYNEIQVKEKNLKRFDIQIIRTLDQESDSWIYATPISISIVGIPRMGNKKGKLKVFSRGAKLKDLISYLKGGIKQDLEKFIGRKVVLKGSLDTDFNLLFSKE